MSMSLAEHGRKKRILKRCIIQRQKFKRSNLSGKMVPIGSTLVENCLKIFIYFQEDLFNEADKIMYR